MYVCMYVCIVITLHLVNKPTWLTMVIMYKQRSTVHGHPGLMGRGRPHVAWATRVSHARVLTRPQAVVGLAAADQQAAH